MNVKIGKMAASVAVVAIYAAALLLGWRAFGGSDAWAVSALLLGMLSAGALVGINAVEDDR